MTNQLFLDSLIETMEEAMKKIKAWWKSFTHPCNWGCHDERKLDHSVGNGAIHNNLTGHSHRTIARASLLLCDGCGRLRGYMESSCGHSRSFYGWQLEVLIINTGMKLPWHEWGVARAAYKAGLNIPVNVYDMPNDLQFYKV